MAKLVRLRYDFEFNPGEAWTRRSEFDNFLAKFLASHGFETEIIDYVGSPSEVLIRIVKKQEAPILKDKKQPKPENLKKQFERINKTFKK